MESSKFFPAQARKSNIMSLQQPDLAVDEI
jgi:hypothetical protein